MNNLLNWWTNYQALSPTEYEEINKYCDHSQFSFDQNEWSSLVTEIKNRIPLGHTLDKHTLKVAKNATTFINYLFDKYLDEDTLLITSSSEHKSVCDAIIRKGRDNCRKHVVLPFRDKERTLDLLPVKKALLEHEYKRVFVYVIGTQFLSGEITPQSLYFELKEYLLSLGIEPIMLVDDVHGIYLVPRDYGMFDYVIATAHALVRHYDMGMLWSKTEENVGEQNCMWVKGYLSILDYILQRRTKLAWFSEAMKEEFVSYLKCSLIEYRSDSIPNVFSIRVNCKPSLIFDEEIYKEYANYEVRLETNKENMFYITSRAQQFVTFPELLEPAVERIHKLLGKVLLLEDTLNG